MTTLAGNKIIHASIGYIIGGLLIKGIAFLTTPIFTRLLSPEEYGILNTYLSYEAILVVILGCQFHASLKSAKIEFGPGLNPYVSNLALLALAHLAAALVLVNIFSVPLLQFTGIKSRLLLNLLIVNSFGVVLVNIYNSYVSLTYEYKKYIFIALINAVLNVAISLLLIKVLLPGDKSTGRILGYVIPYVFISLYIFPFLWKKGKHHCLDIRKYDSYAYKYSVPLLPGGFADVMLGQFSKLSVERFCGLAEMGLYSLSYNIYSIIGIIRIAMDYIVGPYFFDKRGRNENRNLQKIITIYGHLLAYATILVMLFAPEIVRILGATDYYGARFSAIPLVAASFFVFLSSVVSQEVYYLQKTYMISVAAILVMVANIILNIVVIPHYGVMGAAFCTLFSYILLITIYAVLIRCILKSTIFKWWSLVETGVMVLAGTALSLILIDHSILRYVASLIVLIASVRSIIKLKIINTNE